MHTTVATNEKNTCAKVQCVQKKHTVNEEIMHSKMPPLS